MGNRAETTRKERAILKFIEEQVIDKGYPPSVREIGKAVGLSSTATVHGYLARLEDKGYIVDLKVFELSECDNEYIDLSVNIKQVDELLNITKCYYPLVSKEFLRRLLFRVLESTPVNSSWSQGYGSSLNSDEIRKFYKLKEKDLIIAPPIEIGIRGEDIFEDTVSLFENLNLDTEFDLTKLKQNIKKIY